jgi:hypothetical protein
MLPGEVSGIFPAGATQEAVSSARDKRKSDLFIGVV